MRFLCIANPAWTCRSEQRKAGCLAGVVGGNCPPFALRIASEAGAALVELGLSFEKREVPCKGSIKDQTEAKLAAEEGAQPTQACRRLEMVQCCERS